MDVDPLLEGCTPAQVEAITSEAAPLVVMAGAGSGKTRVLTNRIAWQVRAGRADPGHVLALTFTRKAAGELRSRLASLGLPSGVHAGTFHAIAFAELHRRWADTGATAPTLLDRKVPLVARALGRAGLGAKGRETLVLDVTGEIEWAKARLVSPARYAAEAAGAGRRPPLDPDALAVAYRGYEEEKRRQRLVDFDDLLLLTAEALEADADYAAATRWRWRHFFVDEAQDLNPAQWRLLGAWLGDRDDICLVGDLNQAIYAWNGAEPTLLRSFATQRASRATIALRQNWRSSPEILAVAGAALADETPPLTPMRPSTGKRPSVTAYADDAAEARGVAGALQRAHREGRPWSELAVLSRTNAQLLAFERPLRAARIPYHVAKGAGLLQQPEVRDALRHLSRAGRGQRGGEWLGFLEAQLATAGAPAPAGAQGVPGEDPTPRTDERESAGDERGRLGYEHGRVAGERRAAGNGALTDDAAERRLNLEALLRLGEEFVTSEPGASPAAFATWLRATLRSEEGDATREGVQLLTFHRAKGLEWDVVFLVGLEQGLVPVAGATTPAAEAEERRLLYVATTRAREELHLSWAASREMGRRSANRRPSPYLEEIALTLSRLDGGFAKPTDLRAELARARQRLDGTSGLSGGPGQYPDGSRRSASSRRGGTGPTGGGRRSAGAGQTGRVSSGGRAARPGGRSSEGLAGLRGSSARGRGDAALGGDTADVNPELLAALKEWRSGTAREAGVPAYVIFHDATLVALATRRPETPAALLDTPGIGTTKLVRHGPALLEILARFRDTAAARPRRGDGVAGPSAPSDAPPAEGSVAGTGTGVSAPDAAKGASEAKQRR